MADHQILKTPCMQVLGGQEVQARKVAVRHRTGGDCRQFSLEDFVRLTQEEITTRGLKPAFQPIAKTT
jgi:threonyl-tRNA synthetase